MIHYRDGYKYQLSADYTVQTEVTPPVRLATEYVCLDPDGLLFIRDGYAWDGASGPTLDTKSTMRASLVHDALYQLMRTELLDASRWREVADAILRRLMKEDGALGIRAWYYYQAVRIFGGASARPSGEHDEQTAP